MLNPNPNAIVSSCAVLELTCLDMKAKQINTINTEDVVCERLESSVTTLEKVHQGKVLKKLKWVVFTTS